MTAILGTGHSLPVKRLTNRELAVMVDTSDEWIISHTGISERRILGPEESALSLSLEAARQALAAAHVQPEALGLIVCATFTSETMTPSLGALVMRALGAACPAFDLNAACSGFLYALEVARKTCPEKPVLVVGCEILSRVTDWTDRASCILFGDGAGAAVIGPCNEANRGIIDISWMNHPDTTDALVVEGMNHTREGKLQPSVIHMDGREVYKFATRVLAEDIRAVAHNNGLAVSDIDWFVPHQANIRIIRWAAQALEVPMERFYINIDRLGNTSCASVIIALDELVRSGDLHAGQTVVMAAFGGGLTSGAALLRW